MHPVINEDILKIKSAITSWELLRDTTVLITGANGFIPAYMVETIMYLNKTENFNTKIIALVRNKEKANSRFLHLKDLPELEFLIQDVCSEIKIDEPVNFIIHAASQASPKYYGIDPIGTLQANTIGTFNILKFSESQKELKSLLYFSSAEIYGNVNELSEGVKESYSGALDPMVLRACYAESKRMGETMCNSWFHQKDTPAKIIRIFHTYGPGMDLNDGRVFADFVKNIVNKKDIEIKSDGKAVRAFCYLSDTITGAFKVLLDAPSGEVYNIGNEFCQSDMNNLAEILIKIDNKSELKIVRKFRNNNEYLESRVNKIVPDTRKLQSLGWVPQVNINDGFARTIRFYKDKMSDKSY